jgi:hypothetical protein
MEELICESPVIKDVSHIIPVTQDVSRGVDSNSLYSHAYVRLNYEMPKSSRETSYCTRESRYDMSILRCASLSYINHPLWTTADGTNRQHHLVVLEDYSTWMYGQRSLCIGTNNACANIVPFEERSVIVDYEPEEQDYITVMAIREMSGGTVTVHCVSNHTHDFATLHLAIRKYILNVIQVSYTIIPCSSSRGWMSELRLTQSTSPEIRYTVCPEAIVNPMEFSMTHAAGIYGYIYIDRYYVVFMPSGRGNARHMDPDIYYTTITEPVVGLG